MAETIVREIISCNLRQFDHALDMAQEINQQRMRICCLAYQITGQLKSENEESDCADPQALALAEILEELLDDSDQYDMLIAQLGSTREDGVEGTCHD
jgi:hypothetical protein